MYEAGANYVFLARAETARNVMPTVAAALAGTLGEHRKREEAALGTPATRAEVLP